MARRLRQNQTDAEHRLWRFLRNRQMLGKKFRRQAPMGPFVVDFVCHEARLIIEVDGGQHAVQVEQDRRRAEWLEHNGYRVLRFWNHDVLQNTEAVLEKIRTVLEEVGSSS
ncbi:endonuclease domain-containing protein [Deferrisoma palaeochoriense]